MSIALSSIMFVLSALSFMFLIWRKIDLRLIKLEEIQKTAIPLEVVIEEIRKKGDNINVIFKPDETYNNKGGN